MSTVVEKLEAFRTQMAALGLSAYIIPSTDPHQSEDVADRWRVREWLSGFTGSAGTLVVTPTFAGLWTDSRYFIQAARQLEGSSIELMKLSVPHTTEYIDWLLEQLPEGAIVGFDGGVVSLQQANLLQQKLGAKGIELEPRYDLAKSIWTDRSPAPASPIVEHPDSFAGETRASKLQRLRAFIKEKDLDYLLLTALDEIAWLLNIRASDISYSPVCVSFLLVGMDSASWFCGENRMNDALAAKLDSEHIHIRPYTEVRTLLESLPATARVGVHPETISLKLYGGIQQAEAIKINSPVIHWKASKNATEIRHLNEAMRRDGVALLRLRRWLDAALAKGEVTEVDVANRLAAFRARHGYYRGESFAAIVGYGPNGAIVHYKPEAGSCATLAPRGLLLVDSGGQYLDGTTDITRTFSLGENSSEERLHFTLVLQGHIALARARFPRGTSGAQLDALARQPLWQARLNYGHGTGHGVGFFLNVHEGPQSLSPNVASPKARSPILPGMVISNEPGYYREGQYGIRTENLLLCVSDGSNEHGEWLRFETLTLFPIDRSLLVPSLLSREEIDWINNYHLQVLRELAPLLDEEERTWLRAACAAV